VERIERAVFAKLNGYNCAESVVTAFADDFGIDHDNAMKLACGLGGGLGGQGLACGALTGATILFGLIHGRTEPEDVEAKKKTYARVHAAAEEFRAIHGNVNCVSLLGGSMEGAIASGLNKTLCPKLVRTACELVERELRESGKG